MRILLDESLPRRLGAELAGHSVTTVQAAGWSAVSNGELLKLAAGRFDVLLTAVQQSTSVSVADAVNRCRRT